MKFSNDQIPADDLIDIGKIVGAHGIRGDVKVQAYAESPERFAPGAELILVLRDGATARHTVIARRNAGRAICLGLSQVDTREKAEALAGCRVCVPRTSLPPLEEDTYYWVDVIGMAVVAVDGTYLGVVEEIMPTGAHDVYVIKPPADFPAREILVPAVSGIVLDIDTRNRRMRVDPPEGLIDLN